MADRELIYAAIDAERDHQVRKWGTDADDKVNFPNDWVAYINHHATRWFKGGFAPYDPDTINDFRTQMVKVAALAVAAVESIDRQQAEHGRTIYQKEAA